MNRRIYIKVLIAVPLLAAVFSIALYSTRAQTAVSDTPVYGYKIVHTYPHDTAAFTEGLFFLDGVLYESTGLNNHSSVRKVQLETGKVLQQHAVSSEYFGEGIVNWGSDIFQLTWRSQIGFVYDRSTFSVKRNFSYSGEGWALTKDAGRIIMSDGTSTLRFLDPQTLQQTGRLNVTDHGRAVINLNELEYIQGEIWANIWQTETHRQNLALYRKCQRLDRYERPAHPRPRKHPPTCSMELPTTRQQIAFSLPEKLWPKLFEIKVVSSK